MNEYQFDTPPADSTVPLAEDGTREDPKNRPVLPTEEAETQEVNLFPQVTATERYNTFLDRMQFAGDVTAVTPSLENYLFNSVVSQEGIFDFFKNLFSPAPTPADKQAVAVIMQKYRNPQWLAQQTFAQGTVDLGNAAAILSVNGKPATDILAAVRRATTEIQSEIRRMQSGIAPLVKEYERRVDELGDAFGVDEATVAIDACNKLNSKINEYMVSNGKSFSLGNAKPTVNKPQLVDALGRTSSTAFPALDAKSVDTVAGLILGLITIYQSAQNAFDVESVKYSLDAALEFSVELTSDEVGELYQEILAKIQFPFILSYLIELIRALTVYIDKSVNGFGGAAAKPSNEGFLDYVKKVFSGPPQLKEKRDLTEKELREFLGKTIQSESWWATHEPIVGQVDIPVLRFMANGDFMGIAQKMKSHFAPDAKQNASSTQKYFREYMKPAIDMVNSGKFDIEKMKTYIEAIEDSEFPDMSAGKDLDTGKQSVSLPALTKEQIKQVAKVLIQLWDDREAFNNDSFSQEWEKATYDSKGKFIWRTDNPEVKSKLAKITDEKTHVVASAMVKKLGFADAAIQDSIYATDMTWWDNYHSVTMSLIAWIEKSLGRTISKEEFTSMFIPASKEYVSTEGFLDTIKGFFVKPKKDEILDHEAYDLEKIVKDTLCNDSWVEKRTLTEGKVSVTMPSFIASGDLSKVAAILAEGDKAAIAENAKRSTDHFNRNFKTIVEMLDKGEPETWSVSGVEALNQKLDELEHGLEFKFGKRIATGKKAVSLPILTKPQIKQVGNLILELRKQEDDFIRNSFGRTFRNAFYTEDRVFTFAPHEPKFKQKLDKIKDPDVLKAVKKLADDLDRQVEWVEETVYYTLDEVHYWENYRITVAALCEWVDKSLGRSVEK